MSCLPWRVPKRDGSATLPAGGELEKLTSPLNKHIKLLPIPKTSATGAERPMIQMLAPFKVGRNTNGRRNRLKKGDNALPNELPHSKVTWTLVISTIDYSWLGT